MDNQLKQAKPVRATFVHGGDAQGLGRLVIRLRWNDGEVRKEPAIVDFEVLEVVALVHPHMTPHYRREGTDRPMDTTEELDLAQPVVHGFVKFDGCTQAWWDEPMHVDHEDSLNALFEAVRIARREAMAVLGEAP